MYQSTRTTRTLATLGGGAVLSLVLCLPAGAADGDGAPVDVGAAKHGGMEAPSDAPSPVDVGAAKHGGVEAPPRVDVGRMLNDIDTPTGRPEQAQASSIPAAAGDSPVAYDQIVLGALAGATLAGVSVLVVRRRGEHHSPGLT